MPIEVWGIAHPPGEEDPNYYRYNYRKGDEMHKLSKLIVGKNVYWNHDYKTFRVYGKVKSAKVVENGYLWVHLILLDDDKLWQALLSGDLAGLSIGTAVGHAPHARYGRIVKQLVPFELSLAKEGARKDTYIAMFTNGKKTYLSNKIISSKHIISMAETAAAVDRVKEAPPAQEVSELVALKKAMDASGIPLATMINYVNTASKAKEVGIRPDQVIAATSSRLAERAEERKKQYEEDVAYINDKGVEIFIKAGACKEEANDAVEVLKGALGKNEFLGSIIRASKDVIDHATAEERLKREQLEAEVKALREENAAMKKGETPVLNSTFDVTYASKKQKIVSENSSFANFTTEDWQRAMEEEMAKT